MRGDLPLGVGLQGGHHRLIAPHALDERLVDVHLDLERAHVDDCADPGAREPAAGGDRRHDLARLRVPRRRHAVERGADQRVLDVLASQRNLALRHRHLVARGRQPGREGIPRRLRGVQKLATRDANLREVPGTTEVQLGFPEPHLDLVERALGRRHPRRGQRQGVADVRIVEAGEYLPFLDAHPFLDADLDETARHLGGDRRLPARDDIAGRIEHRRCGPTGARLDHGGGVDHDRVAGKEPPGGDSHQED